jgi:hypothetical protein
MRLLYIIVLYRYCTTRAPYVSIDLWRAHILFGLLKLIIVIGNL